MEPTTSGSCPFSGVTLSMSLVASCAFGWACGLAVGIGVYAVMVFVEDIAEAFYRGLK